MKIKPIKAFSIAEAMIALLIGSLILGSVAPMVSKQIKFNNASDAQISVLLRRIEQLENRIEPEGSIKFFYDRPCPTGWTSIVSRSNESLDGYYLRISTSTNASTIGTTLEPALPNIIAGFPGVGQSYSSASGSKVSSYWAEDLDKDGFYGAVKVRNTSNKPAQGVKVSNDDGAQRDDYFHFDASMHNNVYGALEAALAADASDVQKELARTEVRPRSVLVSACRKPR